MIFFKDFFNLWPFRSVIICPIALNKCQSRLKYVPNTKQSLKLLCSSATPKAKIFWSDTYSDAETEANSGCCFTASRPENIFPKSYLLRSNRIFAEVELEGKKQ